MFYWLFIIFTYPGYVIIFIIYESYGILAEELKKQLIREKRKELINSPQCRRSERLTEEDIPNQNYSMNMATFV